MEKLLKLQEIREKLGLPKNGRPYFNRKECIKIIKHFTKKTPPQNITTNNLFSNFLPFWIEQRTVGTHPSIANVKNIHERLFRKTKVTLLNILLDMNPEFSLQLTSAELIDSKLTLEFKKD